MSMFSLVAGQIPLSPCNNKAMLCPRIATYRVTIILSISIRLSCMGMFLHNTTNQLPAASVHFYLLSVQPFFRFYIGTALCIIGNRILITNIVDIYVSGTVCFDFLLSNRSGSESLLIHRNRLCQAANFSISLPFRICISRSI